MLREREAAVRQREKLSEIEIAPREEALRERENADSVARGPSPAIGDPTAPG
jgi:hypothetical protein